jgi:Holliday junction resolvase RusA-like endonuclease|tara:strand:+ start:1963 stop:2382 length:420 start_codon:yes stop_codon:yes gene_type:complete
MKYSQRFNINPVPASRPRVSRWSTYYPKKYTKFKKDMEALTSELETTPSEKLVSVELEFRIMMPKSFSKKKRQGLNNTYCSNNSDIDNYIKAILDSLNGVFYIDDKQVVEIFARKIYGDEGYILYKQKEIENNDEVRTM